MTADAPSGFAFNLRFPGQYFDSESNLFYNWNRSYDPNTGRYTQADPIGLNGGWNRFAYGGDDPLRYCDPDGRSIVIPIAITVTAGIVTAAAIADRISHAPNSSQIADDGHWDDDDFKTYQTYTRYNPRTGQCYSGRTSGTGTPEENVARRSAAETDLTGQGFNDGALDQTSREIERPFANGSNS